MRKNNNVQRNALLSHVNIQIAAANIRREREQSEELSDVGRNVAGLIEGNFTPATAGRYLAHAVSRSRQSPKGGRRR